MKKIILISFASLFFAGSISIFSQNKVALAVNSELSSTEISSIKTTEHKKIKVGETTIGNNVISSFHTNGINYNLTKKGFVSLKIKDYDGIEFASLINREQPAGKHFIHFSTINLTSGIYRYEIILDEETVTNRVIIVN